MNCVRCSEFVLYNDPGGDLEGEKNRKRQECASDECTHTSIKRFPSHHSLSLFLVFDRGEYERILQDVAAGLKSLSALTQFTDVHF